MTNAEAIAELKMLREDAPLYQFAIDYALRLCEREALVQELLRLVGRLEGIGESGDLVDYAAVEHAMYLAADRVREFGK